MSRSRKRTFPKPPVRFHSALESELGKNSNKGCLEASIVGIYDQEPREVDISPELKRILKRITRKMIGKL